MAPRTMGRRALRNSGAVRNSQRRVLRPLCAILTLVLCAGVLADENTIRAAELQKEFSTAFAIDDRDEQLRVVREIRRLLSIPNPPIDALVLARDGTDSGVLARLVRLASRGPDSIGGGFDSPLLQYEATWALTNVASGTSEHTRKVTASGAVPVLVRLLQRERLLSYEGGLVTLPEADGGAAGAAANADVREQAAWALGNVAGDSEEACRLVLEEGALAPLLALLEPGALPQTTRTAVWAASNFGRNCPKALLDDRYLPGDQSRSANRKALDLKIGAVAGGLADRFAQLAFSADEATAADASWGLWYLLSNDVLSIPQLLALELREPWFDALPAGHEDLPAQLRARHGVGPWGNRWAAALKDEPPRDGYQAGGTLAMPRALPAEACRSDLVLRMVQLLAPAAGGDFDDADADANPTQVPALRVIGLTMSGEDAHTQAALDCGALPALRRLLGAPRPLLQKLAAWALSNALAGTAAQIDAVIDERILVPLAGLLRGSPDDGVRREATICLANVLLRGTPAQTGAVVESSCDDDCE